MQVNKVEKMNKNNFETKQNSTNIQLCDGERIDDLQFEGLMLVQNKNYYCFSSDAILLANFVKAKKTDTIVDLCSGSGVVGILAQAKTGAKKLVMVEKQTQLFEMCQKSIELNNLQEKAQVLNMDVVDAPKVLGQEKFDVVCSNPPYYLTTQKKLSGNDIVDIAKFEITLDFDKLCNSAERLLKFGGKFFVVNDSSRIAELLQTLKKYNLEPKTIEFVYPKQNLESNVVLIEAVKFGKQGAKVFAKKLKN